MIGIYDLNTCTKLSYKDRLQIYKDAGFKEVALYIDNDYNKPNESYKDIINFARQIGLEVKQCHIDYKISNLLCDNTTNQYFDYLTAKLTEAESLGIQYVVAHASMSNNPPEVSDEQLEKFKLTINSARLHKTILCIENVRNNHNLDKILSLNLQNVGICYDVGHAHAYGNENALLQKYFNKILCSHLHNNFGQDTHHTLDNGEIDYKAIITKLIKIPNASHCLECFPPMDSNLSRDEFVKFVQHCYSTIREFE